MTEQDKIALHQMMKKLQQHEQTIVQLMQIVASTNRMVKALLKEQKERT
ncbi:hypothetical protein GCM10010978_15340 [Compostibacillus humi]|jgi:uncharacterized protein YjgD (DUF1641 family)|uniref:Uncharacterized protein n=1 Tax=Compostibacillus humi TaxID=1245525 RepID=A0A8J3EKJ3_9BACI|nr:hypothetical protein [Compostibacillus humi]GGH75454.1 hypothetical protein GCM10010978_15340 [Compostibacillus humi]HLT54605.1 hypothetical protein [Bacillota bacterium]